MKTNILHRYKKANWNSDYFGVGKSNNAKSSWRRSLKKLAKRRFWSDMEKEQRSDFKIQLEAKIFQNSLL